MTTAPVRRQRRPTAAAVTLGLAASPTLLQAANITIDSAVTSRQQGDGGTFTVTSAGPINTTDSSGIEASSGATAITDLTIDGPVSAAGSGVRNNERSTIGSVTNSSTVTGGSNAGVINFGTITSLDNEVTGTITDGTTGVYVEYDTAGSIGTLTNSGTIESTGGSGVAIGDGNPSPSIGTLINNAGATISGGANGLISWGTTDILTNAGTISGGDRGIYLEYNTGSLIGTLYNSGTLEGASDAGLRMGSGAAVTTLTNSGTISGGHSGVRNEDGGTITSLDNEATGTISGGQFGVRNAGGSTIATLTNAGTITSVDASIQVDGASVIANGIANSGTLTGQIDVEGTDGSGGGIDLSNSGSIDIGTSASLLSGDFTQTSSGEFLLTLLNFFAYTEATCRSWATRPSTGSCW
jgi:hypothetical protein